MSESKKSGGENKVEITIVVNGTPVTVTMSPNADIQAARAQALEESGNQGQPPQNWEPLKTEDGTVIPDHTKIKDLPAKTLFLGLKAGIGG